MILAAEVVTPPTHLPVDVDDAQAALARAVVDECERGVLWRAIVSQERRIVLDGPLPSRLEIEPATTIVSLTHWTPGNDAVVVDADTYSYITRDPSGTILSPVPGSAWPSPLRPFGSFELTYQAGWEVEPETAPAADDAVNKVPPSVLLMLERAIAFRLGSGLGDLTIGSLTMDVADSYKTDQLPKEITNIARTFFYRPGLIIGRP